MSEEIKQYQFTCLLSPLLEQKRIEEISQNIKKWITDKDGSLSEKEKPISILKKKLAYPLKKYQEAFCFNLNFLLPSQSINQFQQQLNLEKDILRYLITVKEKIKPKTNQEAIDHQTLDKIESLIDKKVPLTEKPVQEKPKDKVKIEELDKKLEEILKQ